MVFNKSSTIFLLLFCLVLLTCPTYLFSSEKENADNGLAGNDIVSDQVLGEIDSSFREEIIKKLSSIFSPEVTVFIISMLPVFELRGSIPVGINHFGLNPLLVFIISITGNMLPVFFILLFLDGVTKVFYKIPLLSSFLEYLFRRTHHRSGVVEKYQEMGLVAFVAIPLPITGAWTGSLAAYLFGLKFWKSIFFIFCGVIIAGIVVTTLSLLGWLGAIIALTVLLGFFLRKAMKLMKNRKINNSRSSGQGQ